MFAHACKMGLEGIVSKRKDSALPLRAFARLAQERRIPPASGEARGGRGLGRDCDRQWLAPTACHITITLLPMDLLSSTASLTPEQLYLQLGSLVTEMPDLGSGPITREMNQWLGRAAALVEATGDIPGMSPATAARYLASANASTMLR